MKTERWQAEGRDGQAGIARAAQLLRAGGTVAFPTETVYGLGANALDASAVEKIFTAKGRPRWDPLIVHVEGRAMLKRVAAPSGELGRHAEDLMKAFWPGPLTLLLPRTGLISDWVTAGRALVGVRMPAHPVARKLIRLAGVPVAAPSANKFGSPSPTTSQHVLADLDGRIDAVLDGGAASVGVESTVFDVGARAIYRPGAVTAAMISAVIGASVRVVTGAAEAHGPGSADSPPASGGLGATGAVLAEGTRPVGLASPGMGMRHYAPRARLVLVGSQHEMLAEIARLDGADVGVMLPDGWESGAAAVQFGWGPFTDAATLAYRLYSGLRMLDERMVKVIVCPVPEMAGLGEALRDRLEKASRPK